MEKRVRQAGGWMIEQG